jgi:hypothetical protein
MADDAAAPRAWTYIYIERSDVGYTARIVESNAGREVRNFPTPTTRGELQHTLLNGGHHPIDVIEAFDEADRNYTRGNNQRADYWRELGWRAKRGEATAADVEATAEALRSREGREIFLINILSEAGALGHEALIASYLKHENDDGQAQAAMKALLDLGLIDKYADLLVSWMRELPRWDRGGLRGWAIAMAGPALRRHQNGQVFRALIDSVIDDTADPGLHGTAVMSLADLLGVPAREVVQRVDDKAYARQLVRRAEAIYRTAD